MKKNRQEIIIDLHSHNLLYTTRGMTNFEIMSYQIEKFNESLLEYRNRKGWNLIFIHGNGNGALRNEILAFFRKKYNRETSFELNDSPVGYWKSAVCMRIK